MSLLTICQNAAVEINITKPDVVAGSPAQEVVRLMRYANKVGLRLSAAFAWQALRKEQIFTAIPGHEQPGALPLDFGFFIPETFWNLAARVQATGPISAAEWSGRIARDNGSSAYPKFSYRGNNVLVLPAAGAGDVFSFEYASNAWVVSDDGATAKKAFSVDSDSSLIDEELIALGVAFEFLKQSGHPTAGDIFQDFQARFSFLTANENPGPSAAPVADIFGSGRHYAGTTPSGRAWPYGA